MNYNDLIKKISFKCHLRHAFAKKIIGQICDEITQELRTGKRIYLRPLGVIIPVTRPARRYYDIKTQKIKTKPAHKDIIFRPAKPLLKKI